MSNRIRVVHLDWLPNTGACLVARDNALWDMANKYTEREFGERTDFSKFTDVWFIVEGPDEHSISAVIGVIGVQIRFDVSLFHVSGERKAQAWTKGYERLRGWVEDKGGAGYPVFVYCDPAHANDEFTKVLEEFWTKIGAEPANRYSVTV